MDYRQLNIEDIDSQRNILIIGIPGAGKASIANAILDRDEFTVGSSIGSVTRKSCDTTIKEHNTKNLEYKIITVDLDTTLGIKDSKIKKEINSLLRNFKTLNLIIFAFKNDRFTEQEQRSFSEVMEALESRIPQATSLTALVVTFCEQKNDQARNHMMTELNTQLITAEIAHFAEKGIYFVGLPELRDVPLSLVSLIKETKHKDKHQLQQMAQDAYTHSYVSEIKDSICEQIFSALCKICVIL